MRTLLESVEPRRLLSTVQASVADSHVLGTVYQDTDLSGTFTAADTRLAGRTVYSDSNGNRTLDAGEPSTVSGPDGAYNLAVPSADTTYTIRQVLPDGWIAAPAAVNTYTVTFEASNSEASTGNNFGSVVDVPQVTGNVFNDANANAVRDAAETTPPAGVQDLIVYLDRNGNGIRDASDPFTQPDAQGNYAFSDVVSSGFYENDLVRLDFTNAGGLTQSLPRLGGGQPVTVRPGRTVAADFGVYAGGTINGTVFTDRNGNGLRDDDIIPAFGLQYLRVYVDSNGDGLFGSGDRSALLDSQGAFTIANVPVGTYAVHLATAANNYGLVQTAPTINGNLTATVAAGQTTTLDGFGVQKQTYVYGYVDDDANGNGVIDGNDAGLAGSGVYVDSNNNGVYDTGEPTTTTGTGGLWGFSLPSTYAYTIRQLLPAGTTQTVPANNAGLTVAASQTYVPTGINAGTFSRYTVPAGGTVTGTIFNDADADGMLDNGEGLYSGYGVTAYLDSNNNGMLDGGEPYATTTTGKYTITGVAPGTYAVRLAYLHNVTAVQTAPAAGPDGSSGAQSVTVRGGLTSSVAAFGVQQQYGVYGYAFYDANGDGVVQTTEATRIDGLLIYVDTDRNGQLDVGEPSVRTHDGGLFSFTLPAGDYKLREMPLYGYTTNGQQLISPKPASTFAVDSVLHLPGDGTTPGVMFAIGHVPTQHVNGFVVHDTNGNGQRDTGESVSTPGDVVYVDSNNNGTLDPGEPSVTTGVNGWAFDLLPGTYTIRLNVPAGGVQTGPAAGSGLAYTLTIAHLPDFGSFYLYTPPADPKTASLGGFAFDDRNANGKYDSGETKTSGKTVFLDMNNNGVLDPGEKSTVTGAGGTWNFGGLAAGGYHIRRVFPAGYTYSTALLDTTLAAGQAVAGLTIGSKAGGITPPPTNTASISGYAFDDNDKNGKYDAGDKYTSGKTIFLDLDNDGVLDSNEVSVLTDSSGKFTFKNLAAGTYHVRRVFVSGYTYSTAKIDLVLTAGQAASGLAIGTKKA